MKKWYSLVIKFIAAVLFTVTVAAAAVGALTSAFLLENGFYDSETVHFENTWLCDNEMRKSAENVAYSYIDAASEDPDSVMSRSYAKALSPDNTNFAYVLKGEYADGKVVPDTYTGSGDYVFVNTYGIYRSDGSLCEMEGYLNTGFPVKTDGLYSAYETYQKLVKWRSAIPVIAACCLLAALACFVYLMSAAGHRSSTPEDVITLSWFDRVPFDLLLAFCVVMIAVIVSGAYSFSSETERMIYIAASFVVFAVAALSVLYTFSARVKKGGWYRNTITFMILHFIWRVVKSLFEGMAKILSNLPYIWKPVIFWGALCLFNLICMISGGFEGLLWWFIVNAAVGVLLCYISIWMRDLQKGGEAIAHGDISYHVDTSKMRGDFRCHGEALNNISIGMSRAVEERMKSERFKTDLITNVSHDLKTPLTSIINYVDLLKKRNIDDSDAKEYIDILERQSAKLKKLTEDLVEASKASSGSITVTPERTDIKELLGQAVSEYSDKLTKAGVEAVINAPEKDVAVFADGRLLWRVFDNLLGNICKYSQTGTRAYIDVLDDAGTVSVTFKNISNYQLNISADELMERFVRGDVSRHTEGSGLGLSIAKSLTELQGGKFSILVDGDLFKAIVSFDRMAESGAEKPVSEPAGADGATDTMMIQPDTAV